MSSLQYWTHNQMKVFRECSFQAEGTCLATECNLTEENSKVSSINFFTDLLARQYISKVLHLQLNCYSVLNFSPSNCFLVDYCCFFEFKFAKFDLSIESNFFSVKLYFQNLHSQYKNQMQTCYAECFQQFRQTFFPLYHFCNNLYLFDAILFSFFKDCYCVARAPHFAILKKTKIVAC